MKAKKFITKAYNGELRLTMCPDWKSLLEKEEVFKDGDILEHYVGILVKVTDPKKGYGYGFSRNGVYVVRDSDNVASWSFHSSPSEWKKRTPEEWKQRLIEECKKRGIWDTPNIKAINNTLSELGLWSQGYDEKQDALWSKYGMIYQEGTFATPIKTISLSEAEKQLGMKIDLTK